MKFYLENYAYVKLDTYHKDYEKKFRRVIGSLVRESPDRLVLGKMSIESLKVDKFK